MNRISLSARKEALNKNGISDEKYVKAVLDVFVKTSIAPNSPDDKDKTFGEFAKKIAELYYSNSKNYGHYIFLIKKYFMYLDDLATYHSDVIAKSGIKSLRNHVKKPYIPIFDYVALPAKEYIDLSYTYIAPHNSDAARRLLDLKSDMVEDALSPVTLQRVYTTIIKRYLGIESIQEMAKYKPHEYERAIRCMYPLLELFILPIAEMARYTHSTSDNKNYNFI